MKLLSWIWDRPRLSPVMASYDDPRRDPNWCWTHGMLYPACAGMH